jgi:hypothetical protein
VESVYKSFLRDKRNSAVDAQGLSIKYITATQVVENEKFPRLSYTIVYNALNSQETVVSDSHQQTPDLNRETTSGMQYFSDFFYLFEAIIGLWFYL